MTKENPTRTDSVRVWSGHRRADLAFPQFLDSLGDTFVPGTLTMLKPYGVSAYIVAVLGADDENLPGESALVVYSSPDHYRAVTRDNLRGRVHRASHYAVFDMVRSRAVFPTGLGSGPTGECVFLHPRDVDWQASRVLFAIYGRAAAGGPPVGAAVAPVLTNLRNALDTLQCQQVVVVLRDGFVSIWTAFAAGSVITPAAVTAAIEPVLPAGVAVLKGAMGAETLTCFGDDAELMTFRQDRAVQFRFLRSPAAEIF